MNKVFNKYLLFFGIALITCAISLNANSIIEGNYLNFIEEIGATTNIASIDTHSNSFSFNSSRQENERKFLFETTEIQEIENEEVPGEDNLLSFHSYSTTFLNAQLFNELSFQLHKGGSHSYKNYFDKSTTKLHVRLQVFII
ncbi:hypothetical protein [Mariniflexile sp. HMF6888]|uniref:hypothetical protein n=1 Tax=Mariniflexile sp. HMF6888 TaxID=3373086 RepID=UPI0037ACAADD